MQILVPLNLKQDEAHWIAIPQRLAVITRHLACSPIRLLLVAPAHRTRLYQQPYGVQPVNRQREHRMASRITRTSPWAVFIMIEFDDCGGAKWYLLREWRRRDFSKFAKAFHVWPPSSCAFIHISSVCRCNVFCHLYLFMYNAYIKSIIVCSYAIDYLELDWRYMADIVNHCLLAYPVHSLLSRKWIYLYDILHWLLLLVSDDLGTCYRIFRFIAI